MARLIPESTFNRLQEITHQLQALTDENTEAGQLIDELDRILLDSDIAQASQELMAEDTTPKTKIHGGAYVV
ncbi:MAG: hypothetical protein ACKPH7_16110 [Planktothrix sp.]|uniref:hypothetical protein n=1 Tax=Planktothrix sp. TaxID=3088171 RepID=UPI0038D415E8